eukprot:jgi/Ulvmu1/1153/UM107_0027.1
MIVLLVLNTDMMFHLTIIDDAERYGPGRAAAAATASSRGCATGSSDDSTWREERWLESEFRTAAMSLLIHAADINSAGRPPEVAGMWANAIYKEFFRQGDLEVRQQLAQTPFFQRDKVVVWRAQIAFAEKVVMPVFKAIDSLAPVISHMILSQIEHNVQLWQALGDTEPLPMAVLCPPGTSTPKQLHVHCGDAVCTDGTRQSATKPLLMVYSKGISVYLDNQLNPWASLAHLCPLTNLQEGDPGQPGPQ